MQMKDGFGSARALDWLTESEAAGRLLDHIVNLACSEVAGCTGAGLSLLRDGDTVTTAAATGEPARVLDGAQYRAGDGPCLQAIRSRAPVLVEDLASDPRWPAVSTEAQGVGLRSVLSLPLIADWQLYGAVNLYAPAAGVFDAAAYEPGLAIADQGAAQLRHLQLARAGGFPDEAGRLAAVRRYRILDTPPDGAFDRLCAMAARVCRTPIATVTIVDEDRIWFKARQGVDATETMRDPGLCASAILSDDPYVVTDAATDPRVLNNPLVRGELGLRFYAAAPIITGDGYRLGTVNVIDTAPRQASAEELATLQDLAGVAADELELRLSSLRTVGDERKQREQVQQDSTLLAELADTLRHNLLPPRLPAVPGVEIAAHYHPASPREIGGDFYDVFPVGGGNWKFVLGDMCGKGPNAAALASLVRYTLRSAAMINGDPVKDLYSLNETILLDAEGSQDSRFCTVVCARLEPADTGVRLIVADGGHPPVFVIRADGTVSDVKAGGTLVGALPEAKFTASRLHLRPGDVVVFYTDGITEARTRDGAQFGGDGLARALGGYAGQPAGSVIAGLQHLLASFDPPPGDDVALLALSVPAPEGHN